MAARAGRTTAMPERTAAPTELADESARIQRAKATTPPRLPSEYTARMDLTVTPAMKRALAQARLDDGTEATARIRAMIDLWQHDGALRVRVNQRARDLR